VERPDLHWGAGERREENVRREEIRKMRRRAIAFVAMLVLLTAIEGCVVVPASPPPRYGPSYGYEPYYGPPLYPVPFSFGFSYRSGGWGRR